MKKILFILAFLFSTFTQAASVDPEVRWRTIVTPHFEVIYDRNHKELADTYAKAAEQAHEILKTRFSEFPSKTYLVLTDTTDQTNGGATFLPYPMIIVYPALPDSLLSIDYYGDWALEMMIHEYTHILNFYPANGFYRPLKYLFGNIIRPNGVLPRWYLEGLAVESETRFSEHGRLRSPRTSAQLRALHQDGRLRRESVDRINEVMIPEYPFGERPYLLGSVLWNTMLQSGGPSVVDQLNQRYSRRVPFFLTTPAEDAFGLNYQGLLNKAYDEIEQQASEQIKKIQAVSKEAYTAVRDDSLEQHSPSISPDGKTLAYITSSLTRGQIRLLERSGQQSFKDGKSIVVAEAIAPLRVSWFPDSRSFLFDGLNDQDPYHSYRTLYFYDLTKKRESQFLDGLRAQDPAVSPDGKSVLFVTNYGSIQSLRLYDIASKSHTDLIKAPIFERLSSPEFLTNTSFAYTHRSVKGVETLNVYDLTKQKSATHFPNDHELRRPKRTGLGVLVASTTSGTGNIAIANFEKNQLQPVTNTVTDIQTADYDSVTKELIVTRLTGQGRRLFLTKAVPVRPPTIDRVIATDWPKPPVTPAIATNEFRDESYQPIKYMLPRYWIPFVYPVYNGVYLAGLTQHQDPAGINMYALNAAYDTVTRRGSFGAQYVNASLRPDIKLSYVKSENYLGASGLVVTEQAAFGGLAFFLPYLSPRWKAQTGYLLDRLDPPSGNRIERQGPTASLTYSSWLDPRTEGEGTILQMEHQQYLHGPKLIPYARSTAKFTQGWKRWLPKNHRVFMQAGGALAPDLPFGSILGLGDSSLGANYLVSLSNAQFLLRGYPTGTFVGRKVVNWNLEYQFSLSKDAYGWGTFPWFSKGWDAAIVFDGIAVDGASYDAKIEGYERRRLSEFALGTGFEGRWNTTVAYQLPITWIFGLYIGVDEKARNNLMPFIGIAATDFSSIDSLRNKWFKRSKSRL